MLEKKNEIYNVSWYIFIGFLLLVSCFLSFGFLKEVNNFFNIMLIIVDRESGEVLGKIIEFNYWNNILK